MLFDPKVAVASFSSDGELLVINNSSFPVFVSDLRASIDDFGYFANTSLGFQLLPGETRLVDTRSDRTKLNATVYEAPKLKRSFSATQSDFEGAVVEAGVSSGRRKIVFLSSGSPEVLMFYEALQSANRKGIELINGTRPATCKLHFTVYGERDGQTSNIDCIAVVGIYE